MPGTDDDSGASGDGSRPQSEWIVEGIELVDGATDTDRLAELQPRWDVPDTVAVTADLGHRCPPDALVDEAIACLDAGASALHVHVTDADGNFTTDHDTWDRICSAIRAEAPNAVIDVGPHGDTFAERRAFVEAGFADVVGVLPEFDPAYGRRLLSVLDDAGVVPSFRTTGGSIARAQASYGDRLAADDPVLWVYGAGNPFWHVPQPDPFAMVADLTQRVRAVRSVDPDSRLTVIGGGRASTFLTTQALLFGCDVRGGVGETSWRYPHSDRELEHTHEMMADVVAAAESVGRRPLTPTEYRAELGLPTA